MSKTATQGTLRLNTQSGAQTGKDVTLTLDSSKPTTIRIEVDHCPCGSEHNRPGSYVDTDFSR
ncbi:hypothetical protein [Paenarthrobacter aurescens]|uniref:Uncharacterized protein n=1 Tax=Paenarthrobacter aurescens TaxID=43663 RepID=A0A4Y3NQ80_PAEAU|nr:hypothetical protein [Paenarthrobacter aurescens]UKA50410.1 hypothetical protein LFT48_02390 [Arthrobacter sp. FW305-123]MDO6145273.1 hypothetical protein [Paenarthrobacter aurescens]MDO6145958.1 hypothetical protein [Paenarthrobacter aurescens]MDO6157202.1 hypothetical protein [Paenarthrobacter aurescens]MDO6161187.1 hypothetical protein [Paenarthrobacter aurescens]